MMTWLGADAKYVPGFCGYLVTRCGKVFGRRTNSGMRAEYRELRPSVDAKGYLGLTICGDGGKRRKVRVHRLVAEAFIPNPLQKPCVRHIDGTRDNNSACNLAWGTYAENEADKKRHGTYDTRRNGKLAKCDRDAVVALWVAGWSQRQIAAKFNVSRPTISRLLNGSTWA